MVINKPPTDVVISHAHVDSALAMSLAAALRAHGLEVFDDPKMAAGEDFGDILWEALADSNALIVVVSSVDLTPNMLVEIGAAKAWNKPIYTVVSDPSTVRLSPSLAHDRVYTAGRIDEIARQIKEGRDSFSPNEVEVLVDVYHKMATPVDRLLVEPATLTLLTNQFRKRTHKNVSNEQLLWMLLRLRKQGKLRPPRNSARKVDKNSA